MVCCANESDVGPNFAIVFCFEVGFLIIGMASDANLYQVILCKKSNYQNGITGNWISCCNLCNFATLKC